MIEYDFLKDKKVALLVWNTEKENDVHVYLGEIIKKEDDFYFVNAQEKWNFYLDLDKLERIKKVEDDVKEILLNADFGLSVSIASLPDKLGEDFVPTGMKWH